MPKAGTATATSRAYLPHADFDRRPERVRSRNSGKGEIPCRRSRHFLPLRFAGSGAITSGKGACSAGFGLRRDFTSTYTRKQTAIRVSASTRMVLGSIRHLEKSEGTKRVVRFETVLSFNLGLGGASRG
jgi:hypothetical protein